MTKQDDEPIEDDPHGWRREGRDLMAAVAGGAIVGMPLLYTMEMWFHGMTLSEWHQLGVLAAILVVTFFFNVVSGFRRESTLTEAALEAVTSVGIGILFSTLILWLIGEITFEHAPGTVAGKVLLEAAAVSIGVSYANQQVRGKSRNGDDGEEGGSSEKPAPRDPERAQLHADLRDLSATVAGSILFALNIAPTEEVLLVATRLSGGQLLILLAAAVVLCYVILFASGFEKNEVYVPGLLQHPWAETVMTCAVSFAVALGLLWMLGEREALGDPAVAVASTVTLGLPAVIGGAAGRLIA